MTYHKFCQCFEREHPKMVKRNTKPVENKKNLKSVNVQQSNFEWRENEQRIERAATDHHHTTRG